MRNSPLPRMSRRGRVTVGVLVGVFLLFTLLGWGVDAYTDLLWFREVQFTNVFSGVLLTRLLLFLAVGLAMALIIADQPLPGVPAAAVAAPALGRAGHARALPDGAHPAARHLDHRHLRDHRLLRRAQRAGPVEGLDAVPERPVLRGRGPEFKVDVGFYVFDYPLWRYLLGVGFTAVVLSVVGSLAVHYLFGGVRLQGVGDRMTAAARAHLTTLVALFVLLKAVAYILDRRALLLEQHVSPGLYGAGYTDINALLPAKEILAYISIVVAVAIMVFSNAVMRNLRLARASRWPCWAISAVAIGGIYPLAVQNFTVAPSLQDKEAPYIARSIAATRDAFGLSGTQVSSYPASNLRPAARPGDEPQRAERPADRPAAGRRGVHAAAAGPRLLRLRPEAGRGPLHHREPDAGLRGRRPRDQRQRADHAAAQLDQPAHRLHPRVRAGGRAGQPGGLRRPAVLRLRLPGPATRRPAAPRPPRRSRSPSRASTTASSPPSTPSSARRTRTRTSSSTGRSPAATTPASSSPTTARAACRSARSSAGWCSRSRTPRATSCSRTR